MVKVHPGIVFAYVDFYMVKVHPGVNVADISCFIAGMGTPWYLLMPVVV